MSAYKDLEKRREYQREWARKKAIQNKVISPKVESSPESDYCILFSKLFSKLRKIREENNLSDFSYWMADIRSMNKEYMCRYGRYVNPPIVEIVEPIVKRLILRIVNPPIVAIEPVKPIVKKVRLRIVNRPIADIFFDCIECGRKMKRNDKNIAHEYCYGCYRRPPYHGECLISLHSF
jgi:hypothetical protein